MTKQKDARDFDGDRKVIVKPMTRIETPDGPLYTTDVDGVIVHGGAPMTPEGKKAISAILAAAYKHLAKIKPEST